MARWEIKNVGMKGVAMAVPKNVVTTSELGLLSQDQIALSIVIYAVWNFTRRIYHGRKNT